MSTIDIVKSLSWRNRSERLNWIRRNDPRYEYLHKELIDKTFPVLNSTDKTLLLDAVSMVVNFIYAKFGFHNNPDKPSELLWVQLTQNDLLDIRALLGAMLPFINDTEDDKKKHDLKNLTDLYTAKECSGVYTYTNSQYNRCIRYIDKKTGKTNVIMRPYIHNYFLHHLNLLMMSIESCANKLYVNWVDVLPIPMSEYKNKQLYTETIAKVIGTVKPDSDNNVITEKIPLGDDFGFVHGYIDITPGLSYGDIYNVAANHLFHEIADYKWLIYDIIIGNTAIPYITYLESRFNLDRLIAGVTWSQLTDGERSNFNLEWMKFYSSINPNDNRVLNKIYLFFTMKHKNKERLRKTGQLVLTSDSGILDDDDEETSRVTPETTRDAKAGLQRVPVEEIYLFFYDQIHAFKKSWFYYAIKTKQIKTLGEITVTNTDNSKFKVYITPKNIYNYCKSLISYVDTVQDKSILVHMPKHWTSLTKQFIDVFMIRISDTKMVRTDIYRNDWEPETPNWFNINKYLRMLYSISDRPTLYRTNQLMHEFIRSRLIDIVFESLIYHGLLSDFHPNREISDTKYIERVIGSKDDRKKTEFRRHKIKEHYFDQSNRKKYESESYYYITCDTYANLEPLKAKEYPAPKMEKSYFDFLTSDQLWTFTYAMNWASQINFFHHFQNNRVMYITGSTGVGKSTQVPKLLMYGQKMIDYNSNGKIICTQPRIPPTIGNARTISRELGLPIEEYSPIYDKNVSTSNYAVQYKYQSNSHVAKTDSFLRIVTDGTLYEEIKNSPFLSRSSVDTTVTDPEDNPIPWAKRFASGNIYDIVIVDEAHEHNPNMDMILTLARDAVYVNNSLRLVIVSATMDDDEPIYRRYYRAINDNRAYPLSSYIERNNLDRANMDRRIHISPPGATTQYRVIDYYATQEESDLVNNKNFVELGIQKTLEVINETCEYDLLLFMSGRADIVKAVTEINAKTPANVIALGYFSELNEEMKDMILKIDQRLKYYTRYKEDFFLEESQITRRVPAGTYTRAVIIATNVAEASITLSNLRYVIDTGYAKTVVYDPLEGVNKTLTLPISQSSSVQRRGRVGRVACGEVYYLYAKEKICNNKTAYKIADSNAKDHILPLLKLVPNDSPIITADNDINNYNNLDNIIKKKQSRRTTKSNEHIYEILLNPKPYLDIIRKQYLLIPDLTDMTQYYTYYGLTDNHEYDSDTIHQNLTTYIENNHDDYEYQKDALEFQSRCYTGYDSDTLEDNILSFYIIHPDENVIKRNMYTGRMEAIKCNPAVTASYYYYLLKVNNINVTAEQIANCMYNIQSFNHFVFLKYKIAIEDAQQQLLVIDVPTGFLRTNFFYDDLNNSSIEHYAIKFFGNNNGALRSHPFVTVKSSHLDSINKINRVSNLKILADSNTLIWFVYSLTRGVEVDALALIHLITLVSDITQAMGGPKKKTKTDVKKFINMYASPQGDIHFFWKLWKGLKKIMTKLNLFSQIEINVDSHIQFTTNKDRYLRNQKIPFEQYEIMDKMFKSNQLNVRDEYYYYITQLTLPIADPSENEQINQYIEQFATDNMLASAPLIKFVSEFLQSAYTLNKNIYKYQYEIDNKMIDDPNLSESDQEINIIDWYRTKMHLPSYLPPDSSNWDKTLESYIRAYSLNLVSDQGNYYLKIDKGIVLDPAYWSKYIKIEKTLTSSSGRYLLFHSIESTSDSNTPVFFTPVKIEWVLLLNPIYYFLLFTDKNSYIYNVYPDEHVMLARSLISENAHLLDYQNLIVYLDMLNDPILSNMIRLAISKQKIDF